MKKYFFVIILISIIGLLAKVNLYVTQSLKNSVIDSLEKIGNDSTVIPEYNFLIKVDIQKKIFKVRQEIIWRNITNQELKTIYLYLPVNAFQNNKTEFAKNFTLNDENYTELKFNEILVNETQAVVKYIKDNRESNFDKTLAKIDLAKAINPNESSRIILDYYFTIPKSIKSFGYEPGENYFVFDNFYVRIAAFESGKWVLNQVHSYSDQPKVASNYSAKIEFSNDYSLITNAQLVENIKENSNCVQNFKSQFISDFNFVLSKEHVQNKFNFISQNGREIPIIITLRKSRDGYYERVKSAVINTLKYLEKNIDDYPFQSLNIVDVNQFSNSAKISLPGMIRISIDLFSLDNLKKIEYDLANLITKQYFENAICINKNYTYWISEGMSSFLTDKIYHEYYSDPFLYFDFVSYYPVYGLNLLSYNEIPIIYSIGKINYPVEYKNLNLYYQNQSTLSIRDSSYKISSETEFYVVNNLKPKLFFISLENFNPEIKMINLFREFYLRFKHKSATLNDFQSFLQANYSDKNNELYLSFLNDNIIDNRVTSVRQIDAGKYEITLLKNNSISIPIDIEINTTKKTYHKVWFDDKKCSKMIFETPYEMNSVVIDPDKKFISDINLSNNSYILESKYWGSLSLAIRAFFWFQNALLIMGSI